MYLCQKYDEHVARRNSEVSEALEQRWDAV
jgi:hypothetical protein